MTTVDAGNGNKKIWVSISVMIDNYYVQYTNVIHRASYT